jgi:protein-tyrosine phosphatase
VTFSILFVCTGNLCRSPAAERVLRHELEVADVEDVLVESAGARAVVGEPMSPPMAALVSDYGAAPDDFRARQLTAPMLLKSDLVIGMSSAHRTAAVTFAPRVVQRAFVLGELARMLAIVDAEAITAEAGAPDAAADRLSAMVTLARRHRTPGLDLEDDVIDPIGQSDEVYARSFQQIIQGLRPLIRLTTTAGS